MAFENLIGFGIAFVAKAYFTKEPIQFIIPMTYCKTIYDRLKNVGFYDLGFFGELTRKGKIWSVARDIGNNYELHVRAIKLGDKYFNLVSHVDIGPRHSLRHLMGLANSKKEQYSLGEKIVKTFLT
jgi:hypothetical protein